MAFNVRNTNPKALTEVLTGDDLPYSVEKLFDIKIPLKDGGTLHANGWFPKGAPESTDYAYATLLEYIPYRTDVTVIRDSIRHPFYAANGFVSLRVDMRGSCNSSGVFTDEYLQLEQDDCLEVFDWIVKQPWSNGNIAMFGKSWGGFNGLQLAARQHPALKTIITLMSTDDRYSDDVHYRGGCLLASDMLWWGSTMAVYQPRPQDPRIVGDSWEKNWLDRLDVPPMVTEWIKHQTRDEYWKHGSVCEDWSLLDIPVLAIGGFRDGYTSPVFRMAAKLPHKDSACIVGPWVHEYPEMAEPAPKIDYQQMSLKWFSKWLYPEQESSFTLPKLTVYLQEPSTIKDSYDYREGEWVSTDTPKYINKDFYFSEKLALYPYESELSNIKIGGTLSHGMFRGTWCPFGFKGDFPGDQKYEDSKCICFDTDILNEDLDLIGLPFVDLTLSSDKNMANLSVRLVDIYPDNGEHVLISWGQLNLSHRDSHEFPSYLEVDKQYKIRVELDAIGVKVKKGHKIRVALSTCDWPQAWPTVETPTLTLYNGKLSLPMLAENVTAPQFGAPTIMKSTIEVESKRNYDRVKKIEYDYGKDKWKLTDVQDGGCMTITSNGITSGFYFGECNTNVWEIEPNNPLSALNQCDWVYEMGRVEDDWKIKIETSTKLTCDSENFYLLNTRKAYKNDELVSDREFNDIIPRNFI